MTVAFLREAPPFRAKRAAESRRDLALHARAGNAGASATVIDRRYILDYCVSAALIAVATLEKSVPICVALVA